MKKVECVFKNVPSELMKILSCLVEWMRMKMRMNFDKFVLHFT